MFYLWLKSKKGLKYNYSRKDVFYQLNPFFDLFYNCLILQEAANTLNDKERAWGTSAVRHFTPNTSSVPGTHIGWMESSRARPALYLENWLTVGLVLHAQSEHSWTSGLEKNPTLHWLYYCHVPSIVLYHWMGLIKIVPSLSVHLGENS